jgi:oligopeptide transport system permease protein
VITYALRRILAIPFVLLATFAPALLLVRAAPDGPFDPWRKLPLLVEQQLLATCDTKEPAFVQMLAATATWIRLDVDGCTGRSLRTGAPVLDLVTRALPTTLAIALLALALAVLIGFIAGAILARSPVASLPDRSGRAALAVLEAVPGYVLATFFLLTGALALGLFTPAGGASASASTWLVPAAALASAFAAQIARIVRDALRAADAHARFRADLARGVDPRRAAFRAMYLALLPVVAAAGPLSAAIVMGGIAVERVFDLPGLGPLVIEAAGARDYNVLLGGALAYAALILVTNLAADLLYGMLDPRVRSSTR